MVLTRLSSPQKLLGSLNRPKPNRRGESTELADSVLHRSYLKKRVQRFVCQAAKVNRIAELHFRASDGQQLPRSVRR